MPERTPTPVGTGYAEAGPGYLAASGRRCRSVSAWARADASDRHTLLACRDAETWFFVPSPIGADGASRSPLELGEVADTARAEAGQ